MDREKGERPAHKHGCPSCGEGWYCASTCLERCGCLGKPKCPHFYCNRCEGYRPEPQLEHFVQLPGVNYGQVE